MNARCIHRIRIPLIIAFSLVGLLLLMLLGCGETEAGGDTIPVPSVRAAMAPATAVARQRPWIGYNEFNCMRNDFSAHFKRGPVGQEQALATRTLRMPVLELEDHMTTIPACDTYSGARHAVRVHVGLDAQYVFDVALEFICLTPDSTATDVYHAGNAETYFRIEGDKLVDQHAPISVWEGNEGKRYRDHVVIQRSTGSAFQAFLPEHDVRSIVFTYEDLLQRLIADNALQATDLLELIPLSGPRSRVVSDSAVFEGDFSQGLCWKAAGMTLTNVVDAQEFRYKAADFATPCPHMCIRVLLLNEGLPRKPGC